jgi:transcriptional regulator with PAS, ATPase and Fis domain
MKRLVERSQLAAAFSVPVLIEGETGTGKELLAEAIHRSSARAEGPFIPVNCGAISPNLVESEFFGHTKGAFTGADKERQGHFVAADGGTLFLDEVGELPPDVQVKLLRALQSKKVVPVGGSKEVSVDVRIVAATNRDLLKEVAARQFREDLYYRLAVLVLTVPPLRQRQGDVGLLLDHFMGLDDISKQKKLSPGARNLLLKHSWPGNVRELQAVVTRAVVWSKGPVITPEDARDALGQAPEQRSDVLHRALGDEFSLDELVAQVEHHYLDRALKEADGSKTKAAELVGIANYQTFTNRARKVGLKV